MTSTKTKPEVFDRVMQEHDALRNKVHGIHTVLAQPEPTGDEIATLLHEFMSTLIVHFATEENDGFFDDVTAHAPQ